MELYLGFPSRLLAVQYLRQSDWLEILPHSYLVGGFRIQELETSVLVEGRIWFICKSTGTGSSIDRLYVCENELVHVYMGWIDL